MDNDEKNLDLEQDENIEEQPTDAVEASEDADSEKNWEAEAKKWKAIASRKAKQAEAKAEAVEPEDKPKEPIETNDGSGLTEEDIIVISRVGDKEKLDMMRDIAKLKKVSLDEASSSQMYQLWEKEHEAGKKADAARLGASTGSGAKRRKNSLQTPGLTTEDHKELFNRSIGK